MWIRVPGERGTEDFVVENICICPPESKSRVSDVQRRFEELAGVHMYKRKGDFNARIGEAGQPDNIIQQYGADEKDTNGVIILEKNEMKTLNN